MRASFTIPSQSEGFLETSTTVSVLPPTIPCSLRALFTPPPHIWILPSHYPHDLSTLFALPLLYDGFPHTSFMVWQLLLQLPGCPMTSQVLPLHFSHGLRTSHLLPSLSEDFHHTSLTVWELPSQLTGILDQPCPLWAVITIPLHTDSLPQTSPTLWGPPLLSDEELVTSVLFCNSLTLWGPPSHFCCNS